MTKKRLLIAGAALVSVALIGGTIAYLQDSNFFDNSFKLGDANTEFTEVFESPQNWKSCDVTPKEFYITNKSDTPVTAKFKMEEYWKSKGSTSTDHTSDLSMTYNNERVAIIHLKNESDWTLDGDGWYVYKDTLGKNESTSSMIESVEFNCNQNFVGGVSYSADGLSGETVGSDYEEATYHLFITGRTEQAHD